MSWTYSCPKCEANLNPDQTIILTAAHGERKILIGFHPQPGNYQIHLPPGVTVEEGSRWDFFCPVCQQSLVSDQSEDLCALQMLEEGSQHQVLFSRIAGEKVTFVVADRRVEAQYGAHADHYIRHLVHLKYVL